MFKKLLGIKEKNVEIIAPLTGQIVMIENVPDPVFSQKLMGDGIAILPDEGLVVSPFDGEVVQVFHTKHALGLRTNYGMELLIHIGLETVQLKGEGFEVHVKEGQIIKTGEKLVTFDIDFIKDKVPSMISPIVITNSDWVDSLDKASNTHAVIGETQLLKVRLK